MKTRLSTMTVARSLILSSMLVTSLAVAGDAVRAPVVHDLATPFVEVWDRNAATSPAAFVRDFKATIAPRFPGFYGIERYDGDKSQAQRDEEIAAAYARFPAIRTAYVDKVAQFTRDLPRHIASFRKLFPDYKAESDIYFVHSLGEMDGGKRSFKGRDYFIFGADQMVQTHGDADEAAFFHHELFHDYQVLDCERQAIWVSLWQEGMATYVAHALNPDASAAQLLLDEPADLVPGTQKNMTRALDHLHARLDSVGDREAYSGLFLRRGDKSGLPGRRGYYLGYLVAQEAARTRTPQQLAKLDCAAARQAVFAAVDKLRADSRAATLEPAPEAAPQPASGRE